MDKQLSRLKDVAELVGKLMIGFIAVGYVVGLFVENIHLNSVGISSLGLLRLNYILAGGWALAPPLFVGSLSFILLIMLGVDRSSEQPFVELKKRFKDRSFRNDLLAFLIVTIFLTAVVVPWLYMSGVKPVPAWGGTVIYGVLMGCFGFMLYMVFSDPGSTYDRAIETVVISILGMVIFGVAALGLGKDIYSSVPMHLGGGQSRTIRMLVRASDFTISGLSSNGLEFEPHGVALDEANGPEKNSEIDRMTVPVQLIVTTDQEHVIRAGERTISIDRELIKAIVY